MLSSYGGIGSVIDTPNASIIIETFDNWKYPNYYEETIEEHIILDDRLVNRLRSRFPRLQNLISIPTEDSTKRSNVEPQANYFPKWFYCPRCFRFMHLQDWKKRSPNQVFNLQCYNHNCKDERLEQVRFILTCDNGHINDLPWKFWNNPRIVDIPESEETLETKVHIELNNVTCCDEPDLRYIVSQENTDLSGIHIKCENCKKSATLKGIFGYSQQCSGLKYWNGLKNEEISKEECDKRMRVKIKTSNSVYYANTLNSLWIPEKQKNINPNHRLLIEKWLERGKSKETVIKDLFDDYDVPQELTRQYLEKPTNVNIREIIYRQVEYDYFLNKQQPEDKSIRFRQINVKNTLLGFQTLVKIERLKKVTVQTSFTRNEPIDTDSILAKDKDLARDEDWYEYAVKRQPVSKYNLETRLLPATENYGEGILFVLDEQKLNDWETRKDVNQRIKIIENNANGSDWQMHKIKGKTLSAREVLIHTLCHLLIREFEYFSGYPMSSLQERLYVSPKMNGFLISAFDGTDGYLGGLTKLCTDLDRLQKIITNTLERAKDCSLDPICFESEGQGVAQLNLAACHACCIIPDTSCELGNLFLDRRIVIDNSYGYFKI